MSARFELVPADSLLTDQEHREGWHWCPLADVPMSLTGPDEPCACELPRKQVAA